MRWAFASHISTPLSDRFKAVEGAHLARAGVKVTVAEAGSRSTKPVVVRQPLARKSRCSVKSCSRKGIKGRPIRQHIRKVRITGAGA